MNISMLIQTMILPGCGKPQSARNAKTCVARSRKLRNNILFFESVVTQFINSTFYLVIGIWFVHE